MSSNQIGEAEGISRDAISTRTQVHPIWAGVGAAGGAVAGAVIGAVAGPVGAVLGLVACAFVGGLAGKGVAEQNDAAVKETICEENHSSSSPAAPIAAYNAERPAYRLVYERYSQDRGRKYLEVPSGFDARLREARTFQSNLG